MEYIYLTSISHFDIIKVENIFSKNNIEFIIKNPYESSLAGGWITPGSSLNEKTIFVNSVKFKDAKILFKKHINNY